MSIILRLPPIVSLTVSLELIVISIGLFNINSFLLCFPCNWYKLYDFGEKTYTNLSVKLNAREQSIFVDIPINTNSISKKSFKTLMEKLESKTTDHLMISGIFIQKKDGRVALRGKLSTSAFIAGLNQDSHNSVFLSGTVSSIANNKFILSMSYLNPKDNKYLNRSVNVDYYPGIIVNDNIALKGIILNKDNNISYH